MYIKILFTLILINLILPGSLMARDGYGSVSGNIYERRGAISRALNFSHVELISGKDTLKQVTMENGRFLFRKVPTGKAIVKFSYIGYKAEEREVEVKEGENTSLKVYMVEDAFNLESVNVRGRANLIIIKDDTIIFNTAGIRTLEGDETYKLLENMPGVELTDNSISILGRKVERTYTDGRMVFGRNNAMSALHNLMASDVVRIRAYDEEKHPDEMKPGEDPTRRVLDIETKSKLVQSMTGHFLASLGSDLGKNGDGKRRERYGVGATGNFFSENLLLDINTYTNNLNRTSNRISDLVKLDQVATNYDRDSYISTGMEKYWPKANYPIPMQLRFNYSYQDKKSDRDNRKVREYFHSNEYTVRDYEQLHDYRLHWKDHESNLSFSNSFPRYYIAFNQNIAYRDVLNKSNEYQSNISDADKAFYNTNSKKNNDVLDLRESVYFSKGLWEKYNVSVGFNFDYKTGDGSEKRIVEDISNDMTTVIESSPIGVERKYDATFRFTKSYKGFSKLGLYYNFKYHKSVKKQTAFDTDAFQAVSVNETNTYNYSSNNRVHSLSYEDHYPLEKVRIWFRAELNAEEILLNEKYPGPNRESKNYFSPKVSFSVSSPFTKMTPRWDIIYRLFNYSPSVEQLRYRVDDTNPLFLQAGNPNLKQTYTHNLTMSYDAMVGKRNNSISGIAVLRYSDNLIDNRSIYYRDGAILDDRDGYEVQPQSTLNVWENVDGAFDADIRAEFKKNLPAIKWTMTATVRFNHTNQPSYVGEELVRTKSNRPSVSMYFVSNFSNKIRLTLRSGTSYRFSENNYSSSYKVFGQSGEGTLQLNQILKHGYLNVQYRMTFDRQFSRTIRNETSQTLNMACGFKFYKRMGDVSFAVYDLLNKYNGFTTSMNADYIENTWTMSYGRYFTVNLAFKFNATKSGVKYRGQLKDGGTR